MIDCEAYWQAFLQGEAFAQQLDKGDPFLGAYGHVPYTHGYIRQAWITGFLDALEEAAVYTDKATGLISRIE